MEFFFDGDDGTAGNGRNRFTTYVLSSKSYTQQNLDKMNAELAQDPTIASELLQSEKCRALFLSDFSERVERILTWLHSLEGSGKQSKHSVFLANMIHGFTDSLVIPLLHPTYSEYHPLRGFADLLIITIRLSYVFRKRVGPKTHKVLLEKISQLQNRYLMHSILPSIEGAKLMQTLLAEAQAGAEIQALGSATILMEWTTAAVELCSGCSSNHGVHAELAKWSVLVKLRDSLTKILQAETERRDATSSQYSKTIPEGHNDFSKMRILSAEDKKSGIANSNQHTAPELSNYLSPQDIKDLELFSLRVPNGIGALEGALIRLRERESFALFNVFVKSFPCAVCLRRDSISGSSNSVPRGVRQSLRKPFSADSLPTSFTGTLFGQRLGPWKICLSELAFKDLLLANKEGYLSAIARRMKELATGQWELKTLRLPLSAKMLEECGGNTPIPLWRATYGSNGRILWQVNVGYDEEYDAESQIITVWRIGTSDEVREYISQVVQVQKTYTKSHLEKCCLRFDGFPLFPEQYIYSDHDSKDAKDSTPRPRMDESAVAAKETLMSNKFYYVTGRVLDCLFSTPDTRIEFPFDISKKEIEVVKHSTSAAFIRGRSGTGKTTCLLFKLLCRNITSRAEQSPVRQIFLTRSSYLAERLKDYLGRLMESQLGNPSMSTQIKHRAPNEYVLREARDPLEDENLDTLQDDKFPLVCTFDQLFGFLEKVIKLNDRNNFDFPMATAYGFGSMPWDRRIRRLIDYNVFRNQYWKKRFHNHKDSFEPDLVLAEILGIIKGSTSVKRDFKPLSREEYLMMSTKKAPVFTDDISRNAVYNLYQDYERQKQSFGDRDVIDRVTQLLKSIEKDQDLKKQIQSLFDEVYVDEVQDNKLLELDLLFTLVRNPYGIHLAGDTAQCISRDNTFRFDDIKARFYEHFITMAKDAGKLYRDCAKPKVIDLTKNYRSHQGIISLAANIVDMLCNGFPGQIDLMDREVSDYPGAIPTMFFGFDYKIFTQGNAGMPGTEQAISDFGAEQVIIVRNDSVKKELKDSNLLASALILTIYQSKGLEFEDVILYNFFSDSIWDNIRLPTLELLLNKDTGETLDKGKYAGLCTELKHLYVAVTRARTNLWMVESKNSSVQDIVALWTKGREPLISLVDINDPEAEKKAKAIIKPGKSTSPEAWRDQGERLLQRALYEDALFCFQRANYKQGENLATAYLLYETASGLDIGGSSEQTLQAKETFAEAAQLFEDASFIQKAADTWGAAGKYRKAAELLEAHEEYGKAALWYTRVNDFLQAAKCYHQAKLHDDAVKAYRKGEHFTELVEYLGKYGDYISDGIKTRYSTLINLLLQRGDLPEALLPAALETLGDENAKEDFYKKFERTEDLLAFYTEHKRYNDFFKLALSEGKVEDAVRMGKESRVAKDPVSAVPPQDLMALYNGVMAGITWSSIQLDLRNLSEAKVPSVFKPPNDAIVALGKNTIPELRGPSSGWEEILTCVRSVGGNFKVPRQSHNIYSKKFFQEFGECFMDLVEFLRLDTTLRHEIPQAKDMAQLPVATMQRFASLAGDLLNKRKPPTNLLTSIGGLVFSHLQNQIMILPWSPLFSTVPEKGSTPTHKLQQGSKSVVLTCEQAYDALSGWLVPIVARVIPCTWLQMRSLLIDGVQGPCFQALQGTCRKQPDSCTFGRHTRLSSEELEIYIWSLLDAARLCCASARLYHHRKFQESDSKVYLVDRRAFLERLLKELTFISPLLNDSELQQEIWETILAKDGEWPHVRDGLASLFFHRLRPKEWGKRGTVSALLEERSFANRLGVMRRFLQFLRGLRDRNEWWKFAFIKQCNELQLTELARYEASTLIYRIEKMRTCIIRSSPQELQSFHSVLSLYEYLSLELINRTMRVELLVPRSRQQFIRDLTQTPYPCDEEKRDLERCLIALLGSLCHILVRFADEHWKLKSTNDLHSLDSKENPRSLLYACGSPLKDGSRYMVRRSLDHLTLCMINMGVGRSTMLPIGYNNLRGEIKQAYEKWGFLDPPTLVSWAGPFTPEQIAIQFANVYRNYNKEELLIIGTAKSRPRFQFLSGPKLRRVVMGEQQHNPKVESPTTSLGTVEMLELSDEATAAATIVQWWRRCSTRLQARKINAQKRADTLSQGPEGQAEVMIDDIIIHWMTSRYRRHRNILRDSGASLLCGILKLKGLVKLIHSEAMKVLTAKGGKYKLSSVAVEEIQDMIARLEKRRVSLEKNESMFAKQAEVRVLFEMPANKLEEKLDIALKALEEYQKEVKKWAKDIENCLQEGRMY